MSSIYQNIRKYLTVLMFVLYGTLLIKYWSLLYNAISEQFIAILLIFLLSALYFLLQAYNFLQLLNRKFNFAFYMETVQLWGLASLTNYLAPFQPGLALRIAHFKSRKIPVSNTAHTTIQQLQLSYWTGFICLGAVLIFYDASGLRLAGIILIILAMLWYFLIKLANHTLKRVIRSFRLQKYNEDLLSYNFSIPDVSRLTIFFVQHFIAMLSVYIAFRSFGSNISLSDSLIIGVVVTLSTLLSILPNNLGIQEFLFAYSAHLYGTGTGESLSIAMLFRVAHIFSCFLIFVLSSIIIRAFGGNTVILPSE